MKSREVAGTLMVRPDRSRARSDHDKRRSAVRIPAPPAGLRCPNPRPVARSGPRTVSGRAGTPRLAAPDPLVPRLSGRCPARATASRRQARSTVESVGARPYGIPVRPASILAHRTRRFQPTVPNDAVVLGIDSHHGGLVRTGRPSDRGAFCPVRESFTRNTRCNVLRADGSYLDKQ